MAARILAARAAKAAAQAQRAACAAVRRALRAVGIASGMRVLLDVRSFGGLVGWLAPGWLAGWLAGWLVGWLVGRQEARQPPKAILSILCGFDTNLNGGYYMKAMHG